MASSNIKLFDENKGNMLSDSEFSISNQRMNGLQTGVASSQLQNKAMYQASLMAYAIAQVMMQNGKNANDTDAVSAFVANLSGTMLQKVYDIATTAEAQAGVATGKWMSPALVKTAMNYMLANPVTFGSTVTLAGDPTENLQAVTKQYVDNVKSELTPVFGDLSKNGWFKAGNFTRYSARYYIYTDLWSFISSNSKLSEIAIVLNNVKISNNASGQHSVCADNYNSTSSDSYILFSVAGNSAVTLNTITKINRFKTECGDRSSNATYFYFGDSNSSFKVNDIGTKTSKNLYIVTTSDYLKLNSGTIELWYK